MPNFNKEKQNKKTGGFSLVELLVVISIITVLSIIILPNFRQGESQMRLQRSANKLYQDFRRVQEMAISSRVCVECPANPNDAPLNGYGLAVAARDFTSYLDNKKYIIYAHNDTENDSFFYNPSSAIPDVIIETVYLEKGVYVKDIIDMENGAPYDHFGVNFRPPEPYAGMQCDVCGHVIPRMAKIVLALESYPSKTKTIYVNIAGLIYED
jgi:prepilin-type N-terminal cleavage/methylation domain-containing protein